MIDPNLTPAIGQLREALVKMKDSPTWRDIVAPRDAVLARFQPIFKLDHLPKLTEEELRPFFYFKNNHHWTSLYRQVNRICADMNATRQALQTLLDESRPIAERLNEVQGAVTGMGKAIMTGILIVAHPDKYGVWNNISEDGLIALDIFPEFERGESFGDRYVRINEVLNQLARELEIDLWTLDALWWQLGLREEAIPQLAPAEVEKPVPSSDIRFGMERHLHDFLFDNWDRLDIGREWAIYSEPHNRDAGYEFACSVGRIDILAKHRTMPRWLVIELKRSDTSDSVVGQSLRYIGWVKHHLAAPGEEVHGLIIAREGDESLQYAVSAVPNLAFMTYEVEFRLHARGIGLGGAR